MDTSRLSISDEERREVAARLRDVSARCGDTPWMVEDLFQALGFRCYEDGEDQLFDYIADLIDRPTCKNLAIKPADELLCSECGEHVDIAYMESADDYHARYCPNCGAEVCDED